ncbi:MAG: phosphotransferase [Planctomycetales bacterium]|nr:phosphotransferase [Planctomycetales bacterium]
MHCDSIVASETIQSLWSGYGKIIRMVLPPTADAASVIVKQIAPPGAGAANPRGWSGDISHNRKLRSYLVECNWYCDWAGQFDVRCRIAKCHAVDEHAGRRVIVLEDLDASGYPRRCSHLTDRQLHACLRWLANFHATFMGRLPNGLWDNGTYWHLETRPREWAAMKDGPLKAAAAMIDQRLSTCRFKTLVHGDAKVANFCFADFEDEVAVVDFQYVGGGCGMKDVAYFLGSCLSDDECARREEECLDIYFRELRSRIDSSIAVELEREWRELFPFAWADFHRFLCGWCATHPKLTPYSREMVDRALAGSP